MHEIKCPHCHTAFTINEASYADILNQVRTQEFQAEVHERLAQAQAQAKSEFAAQQAQDKHQYSQALAQKEAQIAELAHQLANHEKDNQLALANLSGSLKSELAEKSRQITELQAQNQALAQRMSLERELAIREALAAKERELTELATQLQLRDSQNQLAQNALRERYEIQLKQKTEEVAFYKDFKARQSTKMVGESLEAHCETEFNRIRTTAFPQAKFGKDNDASGGSKGDYIFRESDEHGNEIISIMFEMKNEGDETASKKKNEHFFKELDKDRREKSCEYAVLVSLLEYYEAQFGTQPPARAVLLVAGIISWNVWQMDGLRGVVPGSCQQRVRVAKPTLFGVVEEEILCPGCQRETYQGHNGTYCLIRDWGQRDPRTGARHRVIRFIDLIR